LQTSAFTIDVEDGVSIAMRDAFGVDFPQTDRVVTYTMLLLDLLGKHQVKATFFILGKVAEDFPDLVKRIAHEKHEIGVHGYHHWQFFRMNVDQARDELTNAKKLLEDLTGNEVRGHRAPAFSVMPYTSWALDVIAECGFEYDSSMMPMKGSRYGWPGFPKEIVRVQTEKENQLIEVPISTRKIFGKEVPFSGGGYLRLFPFWFTNQAFKQTIQNQPAILYIHPYELDYTQYPQEYFDQMKKAGIKKNLKARLNWVNRKRLYEKLEKLVPKYPFTSMKEIISGELSKRNFKTFKVSDKL